MSLTNKEIIEINKKCDYHNDDIMLNNYEYYLKNKYFDLNDDNNCLRVENTINLNNNFSKTQNIEYFFNNSYQKKIILFIFIFTFVILIIYFINKLSK